MMGIKISNMISDAEIQKRVSEIAKDITNRFKKDDAPLVVIAVLKGSFVFYSDLIRHIELDFGCEFLGVASYHNSTKSSGEVKVTLDLAAPIEGKNVILVEDIVDTGLTMQYLQSYLKSRSPKSVTTVTLLHKPEATQVKCSLDHVGFEISNEFVVGYGLDYQGYFRNLPYIGKIENLN
ncbi:MAG: hypoxanthine-guanine phosphoribosyltransferase-like protein [Pseudomonadota bacterium]|jgi:hypoxanthine phosphoribosyltransferase